MLSRSLRSALVLRHPLLLGLARPTGGVPLKQLQWSTYSATMEKEQQTSVGPMQTTIENKLTTTLKPAHLQVINESYMHNVPKGSETHFKVVVVSELFQGMPLIKRHRAVMEALEHEMEGGVHALSIQAKTPEQWEQSGGKVTVSPPCLGGSKR